MEKMPLEGVTVIVTRPRLQAAEFAGACERAGASVLFFPSIEIAAPAEWSEVDRAIDEIRAYDALIFTSSNAVRYFFERARERGVGSQHMMRKTIYAVGRKTAEATAFYGLPAVTFPDVGDAHGLASALVARGVQRHRRYLMPKGRRAGSELAGMLRAEGGTVDEVIVYETVMPRSDEGAKAAAFLTDALRRPTPCVITFFSPSSVENFFTLVHELPHADRAVIGAIGATTAGALVRMGITPDIVPEEPRVDLFVRAIGQFFINREIHHPRNEDQ
ncbi:MAG: uroporphyrinogen-III synthase [Acidobacteriota bacterium]